MDCQTLLLGYPVFWLILTMTFRSCLCYCPINSWGNWSSVSVTQPLGGDAGLRIREAWCMKPEPWCYAGVPALGCHLFIISWSYPLAHPFMAMGTPSFFPGRASPSRLCVPKELWGSSGTNVTLIKEIQLVEAPSSWMLTSQEAQWQGHFSSADLCSCTGYDVSRFLLGSPHMLKLEEKTLESVSTSKHSSALMWLLESLVVLDMQANL